MTVQSNCVRPSVHNIFRVDKEGAGSAKMCTRPHCSYKKDQNNNLILVHAGSI